MFLDLKKGQSGKENLPFNFSRENHSSIANSQFLVYENGLLSMQFLTYFSFEKPKMNLRT